MDKFYMYRFVCFIVWFLFQNVYSVETSAKANLRIVTLNIRYDSGKDGANNWTNRKVKLGEFIKHVNADIVCMQEVLYNQQTYLAEALPGYEHVGVGTYDGSKRGEAEPIFYNKKKFILVDHGHFWLSETPDSIGSLGWGDKHPHIVTWVKLKTYSGFIFYVLNTHFDWDSDKVRQKSAQLVLKWIKENVDVEHIILTGDFNNSPKSETYKLIMSSGIVKDSYITASKRKGVDYSFHDFGRLPEGKKIMLDYIFVSNGVKVRKVEIVKEKKENGCFLSDHNPVIADLFFEF